MWAQVLHNYGDDNYFYKRQWRCHNFLFIYFFYKKNPSKYRGQQYLGLSIPLNFLGSYPSLGCQFGHPLLQQFPLVTTFRVAKCHLTPVHIDIFILLKILSIKTDTQKALRGMTSTMKKTITIFFNRSRASNMKTTTLSYIVIKYLSRSWFWFMRNYSWIIHRELHFTSRETPIEIIDWTINNMYR